MINGLLLIVAVSIAAPQWGKHYFDVVSFLFVICALCAFLAALRIRLLITEEGILLRSYARTYRFGRTRSDKFRCVPYSGFWNRFSPGEGWTNFNAHMLEVSQSSGDARSLPATLASRRAVKRLARYLNSLPGDDPRPH